MKELLHKKKQGTYPHVVDVTLNLSPRINRYFKCFKIDQKPLKRFVLLSFYNNNKYNNAFFWQYFRRIVPQLERTQMKNLNYSLQYA